MFGCHQPVMESNVWYVFTAMKYLFSGVFYDGDKRSLYECIYRRTENFERCLLENVKTFNFINYIKVIFLWIFTLACRSFKCLWGFPPSTLALPESIRSLEWRCSITDDEGQEAIWPKSERWMVFLNCSNLPLGFEIALL